MRKNDAKTGDLTLAEAVASDLVFCDFCTKVYSRPLLLPCLHTFCQHCIVAMVTKENNPEPQRRKEAEVTLQCPTCQSTITLVAGTQDTEKEDDDESNDDDEYNDTMMSDHERTADEICDGDRSKRKQKSIPRTLQSEKSLGKKNVPETASNDVGQPRDRERVGSETKRTTSKDTTTNQIQEKQTAMFDHTTTKKEEKIIKAKIQSSLQLNHFLDSMAHLYRHRNEVDRLCVYCQTEGNKVKASNLCLQCQDDVCNACAKAHRKTRLTREHQVAPFDSVHQGLFDHDIRVATGSIACPDHPETCVSHFCSDCQVVSCKQCRSRNHYGHNLISLADAVVKFLPEIQKVQEALARNIPLTSKYIEFLSNQIATLTSNKDTAIADVKRQAEIVIQMIAEKRDQICNNLEKEFEREKQDIEAKAADARTSKHSSAKLSSHLRHLTNLGRADEQMSMFAHIVRRHKELVAARPEVMKSKLCLNFYPGPKTKSNVSILLGRLDANRIPMDAKEAPHKHQLLSSLMPPTLSPPQLLATIDSSSRAPVYPSGLATQGNMLAVVDRENQKIQIYNLQNMMLLKEFQGADKGDNSSSTRQQMNFEKPFDIAFLPNGVLAITDPESSRISMFEWAGKFIADFKGRVRHPRGITLNKAGEVVVVDGHLRQITIHNATTGEIVRTIQPFRQARVLDKLINGPAEKDDQRIGIEQESPGQEPTKRSSLDQPILIDPFYVHVTQEGNLVVSDAASPNLKIFDPNGMLLAETMDYGTGPDQNLHPSGVCVDKYGYILVADTNNNRIHLGLPDGHMTEEPLLSSSEGLSHPVSVCLTQEGQLVIGQSGGQIKLYTYVK